MENEMVRGNKQAGGGEAGEAGVTRGGEAGEAGVADGSEAGEAGEAGVANGSEAGEAGQVDWRARIDEARRDFEALRGRLEALKPGTFGAPRIDVGRAAAIVLSVARRDAKPERRAAFEKVAAVYDLALLDELVRLARVTWYLRRHQRLSAAEASDARVPEAEVRAAFELRARMMRVLEHWLGDRADIATELAHLREGSGHHDLVNDLATLSELYARDDVRPHIERDAKHYRASDEAEAWRVAERIFFAQGLVEEGRAERIADLTHRAAALLLMAYDEHQACGRFLFRKVEDVAATYPSIFTASRKPRRRRAVGAAPAGEGAGDEGAGGEAPVDEGASSKG
ncbi:MAG TPA: hypothetical protein VFS43_06135 [Polyangiaceae bacterium]|nr:hypothetical protein [Polyangiaceae bacterium]